MFPRFPLLVAALVAVAAGGLIAAHARERAADRARAETRAVLVAGATALDALLDAQAGVRAYVTSGKPLVSYETAKDRLRHASTEIGGILPGGSDDEAFVVEARNYLQTQALATIAVRLNSSPPQARALALAIADQRVAALQDRYDQVRRARMLAGERTVTATRASARNARAVAMGAGAAGACLLAFVLLAALRRKTHGVFDAVSVPTTAGTAYADSQAHDERVGRIAAQIAAAMGLPAVTQDLLRQAAPLHDVGNVSVPDSILLKPGVLTSDERTVMEQHTTTGAELLADGDSAVLKLAQKIARDHHERWDGLGYPQGLAGTDISLSARIVAVADVFDALTHVRPHRQGATISEAVAYIVEERGAQFDPAVVDAFLQLDHRAIDAPADAAARQPQAVPDALAASI